MNGLEKQLEIGKTHIFAFSVGKYDDKNREMIGRIKQRVAKEGVSMSWVVLKALEQYEKEMK